MSQIKEPSILSNVRGLTWQEFEEFVAVLWELQGWQTAITPERGDEGVDIKSKHSCHGTLIEIQTKNRAEGNKVGSPTMQKYTLNPESEAKYSVVVTSSSFTSKARSFADRNNIVRINGSELASLIEQLNAEEILQKYLREREWTHIHFDAYSPEVQLCSVSHSFPNYTTDSNPITNSGASPGENQPIEVLDGIGSNRAKVLIDQANISTVGELAAADPHRVSQKADIDEQRLERWIARALYRVEKPVNRIEDIGPQRTEKLNEVNIYTIGDLAAADPEELAEECDIKKGLLKDCIKRADSRCDKDVQEIKDIGKARAAELNKVNIYRLGDLAAANPERIAKQTSNLTKSNLRAVIERA